MKSQKKLKTIRDFLTGLNLSISANQRTLKISWYTHFITRHPEGSERKQVHWETLKMWGSTLEKWGNRLRYGSAVYIKSEETHKPWPSVSYFNCLRTICVFELYCRAGARIVAPCSPSREVPVDQVVNLQVVHPLGDLQAPLHQVGEPAMWLMALSLYLSNNTIVAIHTRCPARNSVWLSCGMLYSGHTSL